MFYKWNHRTHVTLWDGFLLSVFPWRPTALDVERNHGSLLLSSSGRPGDGYTSLSLTFHPLKDVWDFMPLEQKPKSAVAELPGDCTQYFFFFLRN